MNIEVERINMRTKIGVVLFLFGVLKAAAAIPTDVTFTDYFGGQVTFVRPLYFSEVPGKDSNYAVLEQQGMVDVVYRRNGIWVKDTLLKINTAYSAANNTLGLLGLAFDPNFTTNRKYYLFYSVSSDTNILVERQVDTSLMKDAGTAPVRLLSISGRAATNNNGGNIAFGPKDGYLYIGVGDGGSLNGDAVKVAQNKSSFQGKFLRIDVNSQAGGKPYAIPPDNPFVGNSAYSPEIWALGVRSPWRWSFDALNDNLWVGEVGNSTWEEVDTVIKGANLGWSYMEGFVCQPGLTCASSDTAGDERPIFAYGHANGDDAIIGGYVYRGNSASPFYGVYFYGDNGSGHVRALRVVNGVKQDSAVMPGTIPGLSSFGEDAQGNLYATSVTTNLVYRFNSQDMIPVSVRGPAPKRETTKILSGQQGFSDLELYDLRGERIQGKHIGTGLYVAPGAERNPFLVPVLR